MEKRVTQLEHAQARLEHGTKNSSILTGNATAAMGNYFFLGSSNTAVQQVNGHIRDFTAYTNVLSDNQMQNLTSW